MSRVVMPPVARLLWWLIALLAVNAAVPIAAAADSAIAPLFDHLTTGFELTGQHRDLPCESCHVNAVFKGTPRECSACHGVGAAVRATAKADNHILSSNRCDACHSTNAWVPAVSFDHVEVRGSCSTCHNNVQAQGMGPGTFRPIWNVTSAIRPSAGPGPCSTTRASLATVRAVTTA